MYDSFVGKLSSHGTDKIFALKGHRICHPKIGLFGIRIILGSYLKTADTREGWKTKQKLPFDKKHLQEKSPFLKDVSSFVPGRG